MNPEGSDEGRVSREDWEASKPSTILNVDFPVKPLTEEDKQRINEVVNKEREDDSWTAV